MPGVVCRSCWFHTEVNQLSGGTSVLQSPLVCLLPFFFYFLCSILSHKKWSTQSLPTEPHMDGRQEHDVLPGAPKGSLVTLLSPPQCCAVFHTIPHILVSVDQSSVLYPKTIYYPPCDKNTKSWILEGNINENSWREIWFCMQREMGSLIHALDEN